MKDIELLVEKIVRDLRYGENDSLVRELRKYPFETTEETNRVEDLVIQTVSVIRILKRTFPHGRVNEPVAIKKLLYDPDYIGFKIAVKIINEEESGSPISTYVPLPVSNLKFPVIPWHLFYDSDYEYNEKELIVNAKKEIEIMKKTGEDVRPIPPHDAYFVTSDQELVSVHDTIEVDGVMYYWGYILDYLEC